MLGAVLDTLPKAVGSTACSLPSGTFQLRGQRLTARPHTEANLCSDSSPHAAELARGPGAARQTWAWLPGADLSLPSGSGRSARPPCENLSAPHGPQTDQGGSTAPRPTWSEMFLIRNYVAVLLK